MMAMPMPATIDRLELGIAPYCGSFAETRRGEIEAQAKVMRRPIPMPFPRSLYWGRVCGRVRWNLETAPKP
jgi:hypothetical protein